MKGSSFLFQNSLPNAALCPNSNNSHVTPTFFFHSRRGPFQIRLLPITQNLKMGKSGRRNHRLRSVESSGRTEEEEDEDVELCPVDCVREFKTDEELLRILEKAKETKSLVVVDFYRTSCGSCKYIEQGFSKLCRGAGDREDAVIFLKHNVSTIIIIIIFYFSPWAVSAGITCFTHSGV